MEPYIQALLSVSKMIANFSKESPLDKLAKQEYEMARYVLASANTESNYRECINRALTHLESAYAHYLPTIKTWDIWDKDKILSHKYAYANSICIHIAILHYILGNYSNSKKWLMENINVKGYIEFPEEIIGSFSITGSNSFYADVCKEDYPRFAAKLKQSEDYWFNIHSSNSNDDDDHYVWW